MDKITDYKIMNEYFTKSKEFDNGIPRNHKMAGNIFAFIIKNNIDAILKETNYKVSINNSFIRGIKNEWDLLIVKKGAKDNGVNIYNQEDVKCVIELKTATFFKGDWKITDDDNVNEKRCREDIEKRLKKVEEALEPVSDHCRYLYVSLFQNTNHNANKSLEGYINKMKNNNGKTSTFFFRESNNYKDPDPSNPEQCEKEMENFLKDDEEAFKHFILESIK